MRPHCSTCTCCVSSPIVIVIDDPYPTTSTTAWTISIPWFDDIVDLAPFSLVPPSDGHYALARPRRRRIERVRVRRPVTSPPELRRALAARAIALHHVA